MKNPKIEFCLFYDFMAGKPFYTIKKFIKYTNMVFYDYEPGKWIKLLDEKAQEHLFKDGVLLLKKDNYVKLIKLEELWTMNEK